MHRQYGRAGARVAVATFAAALLAAACSSDNTDTNKQPIGPSKDAGTETDGWATGYNVTDYVDGGHLPPPFLFDKVADPYTVDSGQACEAFSTDYPTSRACLCTNCYNLMHQCDALPGCIEIRACIWKSGCQDTNSCYLLKTSGDPTGCVDVIDKWGNTGDDVAIATSLLQCGQKATPACPAQAQ
jgi:hypothetical protein